MKKRVEITKKSYTRCVGRRIIERFYDIFLKSHPDIPPLFTKTDFSIQHEALRNGIHFAMMFAEGKPIAVGAIRRLGQKHDRHHLDIPPDLYRHWKASFLRAVSETDPEFTEEIRDAWDAVLQKTIDEMIAAHDASGAA